MVRALFLLAALPLGEARAGYNFTTIVDPQATTLTSANGINSSNTVVGYYTGASGTQGYIDVGGSFTNFSVPGTNNIATLATGINDSGVVVGSYTNSLTGSNGFIATGVGTGNVSYITINPSGSADQTYVQGINNAGQVVGYYVDGSGNYHGFIYSGGANGTYTILNDPGGAQYPYTGTTAYGINAAGEVAGSFQDPFGINHGFTYLNGNYTTINALPLNSQIFGIGSAGTLVGSSLNNANGFVLSGGTVMTVNDPLSTAGNAVLGVNDSNGYLVGNYGAGGVSYGYIAIPAGVPEPSSLLMVSTALAISLGGWAVRRRSRRPAAA